MIEAYLRGLRTVGGINTFAYVEGQPLTLVDPEGLSSTFGGRSYPGDFSCGKKEVAKKIAQIVIELYTSLSSPENNTDPNRQRDRPTQQQQEERRRNDTANPTGRKPDPSSGPKPLPPPPRPPRK